MKMMSARESEALARLTADELYQMAIDNYWMILEEQLRTLERQINRGVAPLVAIQKLRVFNTRMRTAGALS